MENILVYKSKETVKHIFFTRSKQICQKISIANKSTEMLSLVTNL